MYNPNNYVPIKRSKSKWEQLLDEHGYDEKREVRRADAVQRIILIPSIRRIKVADNPDGKNFVYVRVGETIYGEWVRRLNH